jgi:glycosyltransferase involved in cell wall biosynthesis
MFLSIIIPTYNESDIIVNLISYLNLHAQDNPFEIIVSDGGSSDDTLNLATQQNVITLLSPIKGRASQMNYGVTHAKGDVLYFVHADSLPVTTFYNDIKNAISNKYDCGSFRFKFDSTKFSLRINSFFTRFNYLFFVPKNFGKK